MVFGNASAIPAVVICNVHARELLTAEVCVDFMTKLVQDDEQGLLGKFHFTLFYTANLMRDTVLSGKYCIRKDENGVDPNRNYPTGFKKSTPPNDETYGGTAPLS